MKILHTVQGYYPYVGGSEEVVKKISDKLVERGHDVTVFTSFHSDRKFNELNGVTVRQFKVRGNSTRGIQGEADRYLNSVKSSSFDIMMNYAAQTWATDILLPHLKEIKGAKVLAPCGYSGLKLEKYQPYFQKLHSYLRDYDCMIYHSDTYQDKAYGDQHGLYKYEIIPNFADEKEFNKSRRSFREKYGIGARLICLTVSNHFRGKGHSFVIDAFLKSNAKEAVLIIIGNPQSPLNFISDCYYSCKIRSLLNGKRIKILSKVPRNDVIAAYHEADIFLFGSKVECSPLVLFESMASKTPWMSTKVGNVEEMPGGIIVDSVTNMANQLRRWAADKTLRESIGMKGFDAWRDHFTLEAVVNQYEALYLRTVKGRSGKQDVVNQ